MGVLVLDAGKPEHLDTFIRYVGLQRAERLYAILTKGGSEVVLRPRVQSRIDSVVMRSLTERTWALIRESLDHAKLEVLEAEIYRWQEDRGLSNGDGDSD